MRIVIVLLALLAAGCTGDQPDRTVRLSGAVEIGPTPGPCVRGVPCSRPARGVELTFSRRGRDPIHTTSDDRGRYTVKLERGLYRIDAPGYPSPARLSPATVELRAARRLTLQIDSGIR